jgi:predicted lipopolysaccharide heptosyltransferase III
MPKQPGSFGIWHSSFGIDEQQHVKILLLRLRLIGDVVFTTPVIRALRRAYPDAHLAYLVEQDAAPVVINNPHLDEAIVVPRRCGARRLLDDVSLVRRLRRERFDVAIDMHGGPRSAWLTWASGARERIGYDIRGRRWMYTRIVPRARDLRPRHSVLNQWDLLEAMPDWPRELADPERDAVEMALDASADARMRTRLARAGVAAADEVIVIHVSAGNPFRRWPEAFFAELVTTLAAQGSARRIVLSSGPSDREAAARIAMAARDRLGALRDRIVDLGEFDLQELRALVGLSRLFVGGDSGPLHIAASTPTPIVGIYGPTLAARSAPWRTPEARTISVEKQNLPCRPCDQRTCAPGDFRCLTTLTPDTVIAAAERALA